MLTNLLRRKESPGTNTFYAFESCSSYNLANDLGYDADQDQTKRKGSEAS